MFWLPDSVYYGGAIIMMIWWFYEVIREDMYNPRHPKHENVDPLNFIITITFYPIILLVWVCLNLKLRLEEKK